MKLKLKNSPGIPEQFKGKTLDAKLNEGESSVYSPSEHKYFIKTDNMWLFLNESDVEEVIEPEISTVYVYGEEK